MNKALQALIDTILLAAGTVELGGTNHAPPATLARAQQRPREEAPVGRDSEAKPIPLEQAIAEALNH